MQKALAITLFCAAGCLDPTQATIELRTNAPCGDAGQVAGTLHETGVLAGSSSRVRTSDLNTSTSQCESDGSIGSIVLYPDSDAKDASLVAIGALGSETAENCLEIVQGRRAGSLAACIIARRRVSFVERRDLAIPVLLDDACAGVSCADDTTCERATNESGTITTVCVDSKISCEDDGSCTNPGTGGGLATSSSSSQGGAGGMTSSQGGAGGMTSSQGGAGGQSGTGAHHGDVRAGRLHLSEYGAVRGADVDRLVGLEAFDLVLRYDDRAGKGRLDLELAATGGKQFAMDDRTVGQLDAIRGQEAGGHGQRAAGAQDILEVQVFHRKGIQPTGGSLHNC